MKELGEHLFCLVSQLAIRLLKIWLLLLMYFAILVNNKDHVLRYTYISVSIACKIRLSISKTAIKWLLISREKIPDVLETCDFEFLRLPVDHFTVERSKKPVRTHYQRTLR